LAHLEKTQGLISRDEKIKSQMEAVSIGKTSSCLLTRQKTSQKRPHQDSEKVALDSDVSTAAFPDFRVGEVPLIFSEEVENISERA